MSITDAEWMHKKGFDFDDYAFSERVSIILDDNTNPTATRLLEARTQALLEFKKLGK